MRRVVLLLVLVAALAVGAEMLQGLPGAPSSAIRKQFLEKAIKMCEKDLPKLLDDIRGQAALIRDFKVSERKHVDEFHAQLKHMGKEVERKLVQRGPAGESFIPVCKASTEALLTRASKVNKLIDEMETPLAAAFAALRAVYKQVDDCFVKGEVSVEVMLDVMKELPILPKPKKQGEGEGEGDGEGEGEGEGKKDDPSDMVELSTMDGGMRAKGGFPISTFFKDLEKCWEPLKTFKTAQFAALRKTLPSPDMRLPAALEQEQFKMANMTFNEAWMFPSALPGVYDIRGVKEWFHNGNLAERHTFEDYQYKVKWLDGFLQLGVIDHLPGTPHTDPYRVKQCARLRFIVERKGGT